MCVNESLFDYTIIDNIIIYMCLLFVTSQIIALPCTFVQLKYALCVVLLKYALCVVLLKYALCVVLSGHDCRSVLDA